MRQSSISNKTKLKVGRCFAISPSSTINSGLFFLLVYGLFGYATIANASYPQSSIDSNILVASFPGAYLYTANQVFGKASAEKVIRNITLRGKKGFIPINEIVNSKITSTVSVMAFPIYLHDKNLRQEPLIENPPGDDGSEIKLTQLIFYATNKNTIIGKPLGFPLLSHGWSCGGDVCDIINDASIEPIKNSSNAVIFKYIYGLSQYKLRVITLDGSEIKSSNVFEYGDLGGESGIQASIEYTNWIQTGESISSDVNYYCDPNEVDFCKSIKIIPGKHTKHVVIDINQ